MSISLSSSSLFLPFTMNQLQLLQILSSTNSLGQACVQLGSQGFSPEQSIMMNSKRRDTILNSWARALDMVFAGRTLESVCWAFGAQTERVIRPEMVQTMCEVLCHWISSCASEIIQLHDASRNKSHFDNVHPAAAVWGVVIECATEIIYQCVHVEAFAPTRFLGKCELAAGLQCPRTGCGDHLRFSHGGCCDAKCPCGVIVEEKKTVLTLSDASGKIRSGAVDSTTQEALNHTTFFIHAKDGSFMFGPEYWKRSPVQCTICSSVATHNASGEKCGLMCIDCSPNDWQPARQIDTFLFLDPGGAIPITGMKELESCMRRLNDDTFDRAAHVLTRCQIVCIEEWQKRDSTSLSDKQRLWKNARPTNWKRQLQKLWLNDVGQTKRSTVTENWKRHSARSNDVRQTGNWKMQSARSNDVRQTEKYTGYGRALP